MQRAPAKAGAFCVNVLTNCAKRLIIMLEVNRAYGTRSAKADTEERGANPRRRNGTVRCMFFPIGAGAPVTRVKPGKALRKEWAFDPRTESGYSVPIFSPAFPMGCMRVHKCVCTEAFVASVLFYSGEAERNRSHSLLCKE